MTDPIEHVVLLMLENHSFDQMLGCLNKVHADLDGTDAHHVNTDDKDAPYYQVETRERQMTLDPRHEVKHVATQLQGGNQGFVKDFVECFPTSDAKQRQFVIGHFPLDFLPALHRLGREFTVCDRWFSSLPGPTWPNRFFALTGTSNGRVNMPGDGDYTVDLKGWFQQDQDTIFDRLSEKGIDWKVYFHDVPQSSVLMHQRRVENLARYFYIARFHEDARGLAEDFPKFSFVEPDFMGTDENDDHPPHDIMKAEKLIADVYNSLRSNPDLWRSTLLVIVYDEHGGFYDHVIPPAAIAPDDNHQEYTFNRLGVRVPAILVSPWVKSGVDHTQFDHTSLLKYLIDKWGLGPLGERTAHAASIGVAISDSEPMRTHTLESIYLSANELAPPDPDLEDKAAEEVSAHHRALASMVHYMVVEGDEKLFRVVIRMARAVEWVKRGCDFLLRKAYSGGADVSMSASKPDRLSGKRGQQRVLNEKFKHFLGQGKLRSVAVLTNKIRNPKSSPVECDHAVRALASISGRKFHHEPDKVRKVDTWLKARGR